MSPSPSVSVLLSRVNLLMTMMMLITSASSLFISLFLSAVLCLSFRGANSPRNSQKRDREQEERESLREDKGDFFLFCAVIFFFIIFLVALATQKLSLFVIFGNCSVKFATARDERERKGKKELFTVSPEFSPFLSRVKKNRLSESQKMFSLSADVRKLRKVCLR